MGRTYCDYTRGHPVKYGWCRHHGVSDSRNCGACCNNDAVWYCDHSVAKFVAIYN
jgi:hypothetical protein